MTEPDDEVAERIGWYNGTGPRPCAHEVQRTIQGSPERDGTWCVICGVNMDQS